jgi:hypothetical protein
VTVRILVTRESAFRRELTRALELTPRERPSSQEAFEDSCDVQVDKERPLVTSAKRRRVSETAVDTPPWASSALTPPAPLVSPRQNALPARISRENFLELLRVPGFQEQLVSHDAIRSSAVVAIDLASIAVAFALPAKEKELLPAWQAWMADVLGKTVQELDTEVAAEELQACTRGAAGRKKVDVDGDSHRWQGRFQVLDSVFKRTAVSFKNSVFFCFFSLSPCLIGGFIG